MRKKIKLCSAVDEFIEHQANRGLSVRYIDYYRNVSLKRLMSFYGREANLHLIEEQSLRELTKYLKEVRQIKQNSLRRYLIDVRTFLKYTEKRNYKCADSEVVNLPKKQAFQPRVWITHTEFQRLVGRLNMARPSGLRNRALIEILYSTGMRISECLALERKDINVKTRRLTIIGKGGRHRLAFLSNDAVFWLSKWLKCLKTNKECSLWRLPGRYDTSSDTGLGYAAVYYMLRDLARAADLRHISPHSLRHSFATNMLQGGADLRSIQDMLGHSHLSTTEIYTHTSDRRMEDVHRRCHPSNRAKLSVRKK